MGIVELSFILMIALIGCKTNDDPEIIRNNGTSETCKLIADLETYNNNLLNLRPETRGWRDWLIVCSDQYTIMKSP